MDLSLSQADIRNGLIFFIILVASLCIHEWAHAFVADRLGDDTPHNAGRVTLNPVAHMDLFGSVIFPLVSIFFLHVGMIFGWGKPVPINPSNFPHRVRDEILTTLAGPFSNLGLALLAAVAGGLAAHADPRLVELAGEMILVNVSLAVFNLIPLPPLDGATVLRHATRMSDEAYYTMARWSLPIMLIMFYLLGTPLRYAIAFVSWPFVSLLETLAR